MCSNSMLVHVTGTEQVKDNTPPCLDICMLKQCQIDTRIFQNSELFRPGTDLNHIRATHAHMEGHTYPTCKPASDFM